MCCEIRIVLTSDKIRTTHRNNINVAWYYWRYNGHNCFPNKICGDMTWSIRNSWSCWLIREIKEQYLFVRIAPRDQPPARQQQVNSGTSWWREEASFSSHHSQSFLPASTYDVSKLQKRVNVEIWCQRKRLHIRLFIQDRNGKGIEIELSYGLKRSFRAREQSFFSCYLRKITLKQDIILKPIPSHHRRLKSCVICHCFS